MALTIYCIVCNEHEFKLDDDIFHKTPVVKLECPKCGQFTKVYTGKDGEIIVSKSQFDL